jgi:hypothetical protein
MFKWLDTAYATHDSGMLLLAVTPFFPLPRRPAFYRIVPEAKRAIALNVRKAMSKVELNAGEKVGQNRTLKLRLIARIVPSD